MTARIVLAGTGAKLAEEAAADAVPRPRGGHPVRGGTVLDAVTEFAETRCLPAIQANALVAVPGSTGPGRTVWGHAAEPADSRRFPAEGEFLAPEEVVVTFDHGVPVAIDGETVSVVEALQRLNARGEGRGVGRGEAFVAPGALALITAHRALENTTHEPGLARFKRQVDHEWATLVRDGGWCSPLRHALDGFVAEAQEAVSGEVRLVLHEGRVTAVPNTPKNTEEKREQ
jgi:argininosuccinate synthase